jgi:hypothetical protein
VGNIAFGLFFLIMGLVFLIFNKFIARWHIEIQNLFFGFHFGERERKITRIVSILGGIFFAALGSLVLLSALSLI